MYWTFSLDGELTISGTGAMGGKVYSWDDYPWCDYREKITSVVIEPGIISIGKYVFENYPKLQSVTLSDTVSIIEGYAFRDCTSLKGIVIPYSTTEIGIDAFENCYNLSSTTILNPECMINAGYRATSEKGTYSLVKTTTDSSYKDTKAKSGKIYYYKVVAGCKNTAGNSAYSAVVSIKATK